MTPVATQKRERDYLERTIATVRNHREADNCWPQWANIFADEIEKCWAAIEAGASFQRTFDSIMADENDGSYRIYTDLDLHNCNVAFRSALAAWERS